MSWYGWHPKMNKEEAKKQLPAKACRECVHLKRVYPEYNGECAYCGSPEWYRPRKGLRPLRTCSSTGRATSS